MHRNTISRYVKWRLIGWFSFRAGGTQRQHFAFSTELQYSLSLSLKGTLHSWKKESPKCDRRSNINVTWWRHVHVLPYLSLSYLFSGGLISWLRRATMKTTSLKALGTNETRKFFRREEWAERIRQSPCSREMWCRTTSTTEARNIGVICIRRSTRYAIRAADSATGLTCAPLRKIRSAGAVEPTTRK